MKLCCMPIKSERNQKMNDGKVTLNVDSKEINEKIEIIVPYESRA